MTNEYAPLPWLPMTKEPPPKEVKHVLIHFPRTVGGGIITPSMIAELQRDGKNDGWYRQAAMEPKVIAWEEVAKGCSHWLPITAPEHEPVPFPNRTDPELPNQATEGTE